MLKALLRLSTDHNIQTHGSTFSFKSLKSKLKQKKKIILDVFSVVSTVNVFKSQ